jgi:NAD(P)-dependent dehydrogenase (short-subunit alcohol dehydrogenase family)
MSLAGRSAIITGANQGLGREIASQFVAAGANVFLIARGREALTETIEALRAARPGNSQIVAGECGDIGDPAQVARAVSAGLAALPGLEILVNNAGVYGPIGPVESNDFAEWEAAIRINLLGTVSMCRAVLPRFKSQRYGKIVNLSGGGATAPLPNFSAYAASKVAVVRFTETLAEEIKEFGIDINAIAPGALNTRLLDEVLAAGPERVGAKFYAKSVEQRDTGGAPLAKGAALAVFLASADSDGITGRLLSALWDDWAGLPARREALRKSDIFTLRRIVPEDRKDAWG